MGSFVLVPGGWQGGWAYDRVAEMLRARGHAVRAVTPAGLEADPEAVAGPTPNLSSHIDQVVSCILTAAANRSSCAATAMAGW